MSDKAIVLDRQAPDKPAEDASLYDRPLSSQLGRFVVSLNDFMSGKSCGYQDADFSCNTKLCDFCCYRRVVMAGCLDHGPVGAIPFRSGQTGEWLGEKLLRIPVQQPFE